ncbi:DMT family transporter [Acetobacteraceae bacterium H6797]|nr:DMT family transporter [Acetobacteraceae bacterium H6797]
MLVGALGLFAVLDANSKLLAGHYGVAQVLAIRYATLLILLVLLRAIRPGAGGALATVHPRLNLIRSFAMMGSGYGFFEALRDIPLAEGYLVYFTAPFMMLAIGALVLKERVKPAVWGWSSLGFAGVVIAMLPGLKADGPWLAYGYALLGTASYATVLTLNRRLRHESSPARLIFWSALPAIVILAPLAAMEWVQPDLPDLLALTANGVLAGLATLAIADAFRHAPIARMAPFEFSALLWAVSFDVLVWGHWPGLSVLAGAAVVVVALVMVERAGRR